jgi:hypothetical protein
LPANRFDDQYVVDTRHLSRDDQIAVCRAVLRLVAPVVVRFQCDVPWSQELDWPPEVRHAAALLAPRGSNYETSGWIDDVTQARWEAYVTFAPYAYSSDAWGPGMRSLADVNDVGTSLVVRVPPDQVHQLKRSVHGADVVPLRQLRAQSRASRRWRFSCRATRP